MSGEMGMHYGSTRGGESGCGFRDMLLRGPAADGGLFLPERWPVLPPAAWEAMPGLSFQERLTGLILPYTGGALSPSLLRRMVGESHAGFRHPAVAPLVQTGDCDWIMELFHGPTWSFKDFALQLLGPMLDHELTRRGERSLVVGATSGDTGSAAIAGCRGRAALDVLILHPAGRISDIQRRQMTTVTDANVHNLAIAGSFDDAQRLLKALFRDPDIQDRYRLSAVNSVNFMRLVAQTGYYATAACLLGSAARPIALSVPSGNFGDAFAGYMAAKMGAPICHLAVAVNHNDLLARFFESGCYRPGTVSPSLSPSMDIQLASNFERLLAEICNRDADRVRALMTLLETEGEFRVSGPELARASGLFSAFRVSEAETVAEIGAYYRTCGYLADPHTAVGLVAARRLRTSGKIAATCPLVTLATAHPGKFPLAVRDAIGHVPALPGPLAALAGLPERFAALPPGPGALAGWIRQNIPPHRNPGT